MTRDKAIFKHVMLIIFLYHVVGSESDIQDAYRHILLNLKKEGATYLSEEFWIYEGQEKELAKMKEKDKKNEEEEKK